MLTLQSVQNNTKYSEYWVGHEVCCSKNNTASYSYYIDTMGEQPKWSLNESLPHKGTHLKDNSIFQMFV